MDECLTSRDLADLAANRLAELSADSVRTHIAVCDRCRAEYEAISASLQSATKAVEPSDRVFRPAVPAPAQRRRSGSRFPHIDGYHITAVLGQGGMGIVYDAHQIKLNRRVALKVLPAIVGSANPAAVARFRREASAAARLHHTNIIPIYDFGESNDAYFFAMELVVGEPLNELIPKLGDVNAGAASATRVTDILRTLLVPVPGPAGATTDGVDAPSEATRLGGTSTGRGHAYSRQVARWVADAADALHYAHSEGIIHRDIKPSNLILSHDGRLMIADFGLARNVDDQSMTVTGAFMGSLRYASPEQALARRLPVDHRTDVYSLGATLYELLCFQPAFPGDNEKEVLAGVISRDPTPLRKVLASIPAELETICHKAMEKSQEARYTTARAFSEDLRRFLQDLPISAKPPGPARRAVKFVRRHKLPVLAVTAAIVIAWISGLAVRQKRFAIEAENRRAVEERIRREAEIRSRLDSAISLRELGHWDRAERELASALEQSPESVEVILYLVWLRIEYLKQQADRTSPADYTEILELCERALALAPTDSRALNYYSIVLKNLRRYPEAIEAVRKVLGANPDAYDAWANLGAYYALAGDITESLRCLQRAAELVESAKIDRAEDRAAVYRNLASVEAIRGNAEAEHWISKAIDEHPTDASAWVVRVRIRLVPDALVDLRAALGDADHADRLATGRNPLAKRMLATALLRNGEHERAIVEAQAALAAGDIASHNHLIIAIAESGLGNRVVGNDHLRAAQRQIPATLAGQPFLATYQSGFLWFESAAELEALVKEATEALAGS